MIYSSFPVCCLNSAEPIINGSFQGVGVPLACIGSNLQASRPDWSTANGDGILGLSNITNIFHICIMPVSSFPYREIELGL